jgi:hypothetical protein
VIEALGSPLGPIQKVIYKQIYTLLYPDSYQDESDRQISFNNLIKSAISLSSTIGALGSPLGPYPESDLATDLYSVSTPNLR